MQKRTHIIFMIINGIFVITNAFFLAFGTTPTVNLIAALFSLLGFSISYYNYLQEVDEHDRR